MTMPQYQRQGFGRFLIDFSYLLSRRECLPGTPEKPLSDLGRVSYHAYWRSIVLDHLSKTRDKKLSVQEITNSSGMCSHDIIATLQLLDMLTRKDGKFIITSNKKLIDEYVAKLSNMKDKRIELDPDCLRWTPLVPNTTATEDENEDSDKEMDKRKSKITMKEANQNNVREKRKCRQNNSSPSRTNQTTRSAVRKFELESSDIEPQAKKSKLDGANSRKNKTEDDKVPNLKKQTEKQKTNKLEKTFELKSSDKLRSKSQTSSTSKHKINYKPISPQKTSQRLSNRDGKDERRSERLASHDRITGNERRTQSNEKSDSSNKTLEHDRTSKLSRLSENNSRSAASDKNKILAQQSCSDNSVSESNYNSVRKSSSVRSGRRLKRRGPWKLKVTEKQIAKDEQSFPPVDDSRLQEAAEDGDDEAEEEPKSKPLSVEEENKTEDKVFNDISNIKSQDQSTANLKTEPAVPLETKDTVANDEETEMDTTASDCKESSLHETLKDNLLEETQENIVPMQQCISDSAESKSQIEQQDENDDDDEEEEGEDEEEEGDEEEDEEDGDEEMEEINQSIDCSKDFQKSSCALQETLITEVSDEMDRDHHSKTLENSVTLSVCGPAPLTPVTPGSCPQVLPLGNVHGGPPSSQSSCSIDENQLLGQNTPPMSASNASLSSPAQSGFQEVTATGPISGGQNGIASTSCYEEPLSHDMRQNYEQLDSNPNADSKLHLRNDISQRDSLSLDNVHQQNQHNAQLTKSQEVANMYQSNSNSNNVMPTSTYMAQLDLESPTSISSNEMTQNSVETPQPPPPAQHHPPQTQQNFSDCAQITHSPQHHRTPNQNSVLHNSSHNQSEANQHSRQQQQQQQQHQQQQHHHHHRQPTQRQQAQQQSHPPPHQQQQSPQQTSHHQHNSHASHSHRHSHSQHNLSPMQHNLNQLTSSYCTNAISMSATLSCGGSSLGGLGGGGNLGLLNSSLPPSMVSNCATPNMVAVSANYMRNVNVQMPPNTSAYVQSVSNNASYVSLPVAAVIQHHPISHQNSGATQRLTHVSTPVSNCSGAPSPAPNFYIQTTGPPHTPVPTSQPPQQTNTSCSLAKLQQLTNGIMDLVPSPSACNTMTPPPNLTSPPPVNMTPPPSIQRNLTPPISSLQSQVALTSNQHYYKSFNRGRQVQRTPNITINHNIMASYPTINGYRMQQGPTTAMLNTASYITNTGFINQGQLPTAAAVQMGMMNMHPESQYQDGGIQPQRPQNAMYATYSVYNGSIPPQALNSIMRR